LAGRDNLLWLRPKLAPHGEPLACLGSARNNNADQFLRLAPSFLGYLNDAPPRMASLFHMVHDFTWRTWAGLVRSRPTPANRRRPRNSGWRQAGHGPSHRSGGVALRCVRHGCGLARQPDGAVRELRPTARPESGLGEARRRLAGRLPARGEPGPQGGAEVRE